MVELITLSIFVGGLVFGALVSGVLSKRYAQAKQSMLLQEAVSKEQLQLERINQKQITLEDLKTRLIEREQVIDTLQLDVKRQYGMVAELTAKLDVSKKDTEEKVKLLCDARDQMKVEFQNIANRLLEEKSEKFTAQNKENMANTLNPLRDQLVDFRKRIDDVYDKESKDRTSLLHEIVSLKDLNVRMSEETINLTRALKGDNKTQGNWGEMVLERVLEQSGLQKGREYETQATYTGDDGQRSRPDVIVHLPENKDVIIDSKVSLKSWEQYCTASDDVVAAVALKSHIDSINQHVNGLSKKDYSGLSGLQTLDFVLMFVPIEGAFVKALEIEPDFFAKAFDKNIMVVCPSTLLVTLRTIQNIWRYEYQNQNALEIASKAGALHDQFVLFVESLDDVGDKIEKAQTAYELAHKRLISGRGNLVRRTQQLETLGAKAKKKLPPSLQAAFDDIESVEETESTE